MPHKTPLNDPLGGFSDIFNSLICCQSNDQPQRKSNLSRKSIKPLAFQQYSKKLSSPPPSAAPDCPPAIYTRNFLTRQNSNPATDSDQLPRSSSEAITPKMSLSLSEQRPLDPPTPATSPSFLSQAIETSLTPSAMTFNHPQLLSRQPPISAPSRQSQTNGAIEISLRPTKVRVVGEMTI